MLIKNRDNTSLTENDITDESTYLKRRQLLKNIGFIGAGTLLAGSSQAAGFNLFGDDSSEDKKTKFVTEPLGYKKDTPGSDILTPEQKVISHNNFYEFGAQKHQPAELSQHFKVKPWQLTISGLVDKEITLDYDDLLKLFPLEERIYRLRCVEAWSMVVPWIGFELSKLIALANPTSNAKYVAFKTLHDPQQMPGQANRRLGGGISFPYVEGLRLDEAMNPLTLMSVGLYGKTLAPQNGAPIRLVVPWKYGFKSIKSIVGIELVDKKPPTTWNMLAPREYGFYSNVNPNISHPRWSQASERRITGGGLLSRNRIPTEMFNGYGKEVAHLYKGMDLAKNY